VFTVSGSAGRYAMGNPKILTDLTIGGIIDDWAPEETQAASRRPSATEPSLGDASPQGGIGREPRYEF
jgi:hypothetical protein